MIGEEPFPWLEDNHNIVMGPDKAETRYQGMIDETVYSSTTANMDRYDYINMLAEARIVDIAWIH